jgi:hypothetical protein
MRLADKTNKLQGKAKLLEMAQEWFSLAMQADAPRANGKGLVS